MRDGSVVQEISLIYVCLSTTDTIVMVTIWAIQYQRVDMGFRGR